MNAPPLSFILVAVLLLVVPTNADYLECKYHAYHTKCLGEFTALRLENRGIGPSFPDDINSAITCLQLKHNSIQGFPGDLRPLKNVVTLDLAHNHISTLPSSLEAMGVLEIVDLSHNRLYTLSPDTKFPASLRALRLAGNELTRLPSGFRIPSLFVFDLAQNQFTDIPEHFCVSNQLIRLDFMDNPVLHDISDFIAPLNKCKNVNNIPFCFFIDTDYMKCDCSVLESLVFSKPSFLIGSSMGAVAEMQCSKMDSKEDYSGRRIYDLDRHRLGQDCNIAASRGGNNTSRRSNSDRQHAASYMTLASVVIAAFLTLF